MKRIWSLLLAAVLAACLCVSAGAEQTLRKMETAADADEFVAAFLGDHPEDMDGVWAFTPKMEAAVTQLGGLAGMAKQLAMLGVPKTIYPAWEGETQGLKAFHVSCAFSLTLPLSRKSAGPMTMWIRHGILLTWHIIRSHGRCGTPIH